MMEKPVFIVAPGAGEKLRETLHFSSAVRTGDRVETSGQGGWNDQLEIPGDVAAKIAGAFRNIELVLTEAGASWDHVVHVSFDRLADVVTGFVDALSLDRYALYASTTARRSACLKISNRPKDIYR